MSDGRVRFPGGFRLETLRREHPRRKSRSGQSQVEQWIATKALQHQEKQLSMTRVGQEHPLFEKVLRPDRRYVGTR